MKVLPRKEFKELAQAQGYDADVTGFIDKETHQPVILKGVRTTTRLHELGHQSLEHLPRSIKYWGRGKKDVYSMRESWVQTVDDEIEAEVYAWNLMGRKITPKVGIRALSVLLGKGWKPYRALSLVIGRLRHYGIETSWKDRMEIVRIIERARGEPIREYESFT